MSVIQRAIPTKALANGAAIPLLGFGSGTAMFKRPGSPQIDELDLKTVEAIKDALKLGFTHIDTAEIYGTEPEVGIAVAEFTKENNVARESLFITSKIYPKLPDVKQALRDSLAKLQLDYLDLYLIHAPFKEGIDWLQVWKELEQAVDDGLVRSIGVSNFRVSDLKTILDGARIKPVVNQIEAHPYLQQPELEQYCKDNGIVLEAYSPLMPLTKKTGGPVDPVVQELATQLDLTPGQVLLQWNVLRGFVPITTSFTPARITEYLEALELLHQPDGTRKLSQEQVDAISKAGATIRYRNYWQTEFGGAEA